MTTFLESGMFVLLLKVTAVLGFSWTVYALLARANPRWKVLCLRLTAISVFALPLATVLMPRTTLRILPAQQLEQNESVLTTSSAQQPHHTRSSMPPGDQKPLATDNGVELGASVSPGLSNRSDFSQVLPGILGWGALFAGLPILIVRTTMSIQRIRALISETVSAEESTQVLFANVLAELGESRDVPVRLSRNISTPFLTGLLKPVLVIPESMTRQTPSNDLRAVLLHEGSHVANNDLPWNALMHAVGSLLWFHPFVWYLSKAHDESCELVSDAVAAEKLENPGNYSRLLARIAVDLSGKPLPRGGIPMARVSELSHRLTFLKRGIPAVPIRGRFIASLGVAAFLAIGAMGGLRLASAQDTRAEKVETIAVSQHDDLQRMIDSAPSAAILQLEAGVYDKPVKIGKSLTLRGESTDATLIRLLNDGPALRIDDAPQVHIENLSLHWGLKSTDARIEDNAAVVVRDSNVVFDGVHLEPYDRPETTPSAMKAAGRSDVRFLNGTARGFAYTLLYTDGAEGRVESSVLTEAGHSVVTLHQYSKVAIIGNILGFCGYHAVRNTGGTMDMQDNLVIGDVRAGAYLGNKSAHGVIANNIFADSNGEIWAYAASDVVIENNLFLNSRNTAIGMQDSCSLVIRSNSFVSNPSAVTVYRKGGNGAPVLAGNHYWNNETRFVEIAGDPDVIQGNPQFEDPANWLFAPLPDSPLLSTNERIGLKDPDSIRRLRPLWPKTGRAEPAFVTFTTPEGSK